MHTFPGGILEEDLQIKMVREGFQKKTYKLGLLAQPPLTPLTFGIGPNLQAKGLKDLRLTS